MSGYFGSGALRHLAPGLAAFINETAGVFRLLISPVLDQADQDALRRGARQPEEVLAEAARTLLTDGRVSRSALERHTLECLSYLLARERLEIRFVLMRDGGVFHPKVWIFSDDNDVIVVHGSSNVTAAGLLFNFETVSVERAWANDEARERSVRFEDLFARLWTGSDSDTVTIGIPEGLRIAVSCPEVAPTMSDFWAAWQADTRDGLAPPLPIAEPSFDRPEHVTGSRLAIPAGLEWEAGPFAHQAAAVHAWEAADGRGLLAMATGSGKTVTSLICATRLQNAVDRLLVVIAAPYRPLVEQWTGEVDDFGMTALPLAGSASSRQNDAIREAIRRLDRGVSTTEVAVVTHDFLVSDGFYSVLEGVPPSLTTLLIADEVHNLGRPRFIARAPHQFQYRVGLSATPVLQYNEAGTDAISSFFGDTVFEFSLAQAIGVCLVPYNYYLHPVELAEGELVEWDELTAKLVRAGFMSRDEGVDEVLSPEILALLVKRRAVLEAAAAKVDMLRELVVAEGVDDIAHTLVYCSDKRPEQLRAVNRVLLEAGLFVRQLTAEESGDRRKTEAILEDFARGEYQVLTCKRVLDEGVDIPQVRQAFLLASSTVRRQWIQRRGRILRRCDAIGKNVAHLHDFIVVPRDQRSASGRAIMRQELERARAFAELAANSGTADGPFATMREVAV
jgi:superfamily II DNA or RNA helicase